MPLSSIGNELLSGDSQLIEMHHLGIPLGIYRRKPGYIRLLRIGGWSLVVISSVAFVSFLLALVVQPYALSVASLWPVVMSIVIIAPCSIGGYLLRFLVPQEESTHLIICEHGLLQRKHKHVEVVYWKDILAIDIASFSQQESRLLSRKGRTLLLSDMYQNLAGLVQMSRQQWRLSRHNSEIDETKRVSGPNESAQRDPLHE